MSVIEVPAVASEVKKTTVVCKDLIGRATGIAFGILTQVLFAWTAIQLFCFLRYSVVPGSKELLWLDFLLASSFTVPHSLLLWPRVQRMIKQHFPAPFYGSLFCVSTCVSLLLIFRFWSGSSRVLWQLEGLAEHAVLAGFFASWVGLIYSIRLTGLGYQTGWTPWWYWWRGKAEPRRAFTERGAYRWLRHPVYLSFLGLVWFTPRMTADHAVLTAVWTVYIFLGSYFKDRRLLKFLGPVYADYQSRVPGYPLIGFGPLGKVRVKPDYAKEASKLTASVHGSTMRTPAAG